MRDFGDLMRKIGHWLSGEGDGGKSAPDGRERGERGQQAPAPASATPQEREKAHIERKDRVQDERLRGLMERLNDADQVMTRQRSVRHIRSEGDTRR